MSGASTSPGPGIHTDLAARVRRLEERLDALTGSAERPAEAPPGHPADHPADHPAAADGHRGDGRFWALEGLRERVDADGAVLFTGTVRLPDGELAEWQQDRSTGALLDSEWAGTADALAALGHPVRLLLLGEVLRGTRAVADLSAVEGLGTSGQVYHHLRALVATGWLRPAGRGRYEVPVSRVVPLLVVIAAAQRY